ncbi:MAG TPA: endolytic transglycosylase MltG [Allosphingosinicella sp.]|jgi:UPF0755 protein|nr:endolytic transglycosylase MltG [Allosphingosinicella sp.]
MKKLLAFGVAAILLVVAIGGFWLIQGWHGAGPAAQPVSIVVPRGASLPKVANLLKRAGAISSTERFLFQAKFLGHERGIKAGEYEFPAHASASRILWMLENGKILQRFVIVPEGWPSILVWERLTKAPALTGTVPAPDEGSILPDAYSYQRGETRAAVLKRMQAAMAKTLDKLWAGRAPDTPVKDEKEALILASIVEKETGKPSERAMVAGVYANRLRQGIKLDADPTTIYPITQGKPLGRRILESELHAVNGYNTYTRPGLPVGPITNPGKDSIYAALHPAQTQALYFVADGTGGHVFANTLAEQNANVEKWRALRRAQGF